MIQSFLRLIHEVNTFPERLMATSVKPYEGLRDKAHQFVTFLKPALLRPSHSLRSILETIHEHYRAWDIHIQATRVFSGASLQQRGLIEQRWTVSLVKDCLPAQRVCEARLHSSFRKL